MSQGRELTDAEREEAKARGLYRDLDAEVRAWLANRLHRKTRDWKCLNDLLDRHDPSLEPQMKERLDKLFERFDVGDED